MGEQTWGWSEGTDFLPAQGEWRVWQLLWAQTGQEEENSLPTQLSIHGGPRPFPAPLRLIPASFVTRTLEFPWWPVVEGGRWKSHWQRMVLGQQSGCLSTRDPLRHSTPSSLLNSNHLLLLPIYRGLKMCLFHWLADVCLTDTKIKPGTQQTQQIKKISLKLEASEVRFWE